MNVNKISAPCCFPAAKHKTDKTHNGKVIGTAAGAAAGFTLLAVTAENNLELMTKFASNTFDELVKTDTLEKISKSSFTNKHVQDAKLTKLFKNSASACAFLMGGLALGAVIDACVNQYRRNHPQKH